MKTMKLACGAFVFLLAVACDDIIADSSFDLWCGDQLCKWTTDVGSIQRVSTWHEKDYGVELVATPTILSQRIDVSGERCLRFKIIADVAAEAEVSLDLDYFADGVVDQAESIPGVHWKTQELLVRLPDAAVRSLRLSLHKKGPGRAVFGALSADFVSDCYGEPQSLGRRGNGAECRTTDECDSGICSVSGGGADFFRSTTATCGECENDSQCGTDATCGLFLSATSGLTYRACKSTGESEDGDACVAGAECSAGHCGPSSVAAAYSVCGECSGDGDCAPGRVCGARSTSKDTRYRECVAPASVADHEACYAGAECRSGHCCAGNCIQDANDCNPFSGVLLTSVR